MAAARRRGALLLLVVFLTTCALGKDEATTAPSRGWRSLFGGGWRSSPKGGAQRHEARPNKTRELEARSAMRNVLLAMNRSEGDFHMRTAPTVHVGGSSARATRSDSPFSVTLMTHASLDRLWNMKSICERWRGPFSLALYAPANAWRYKTAEPKLKYCRPHLVSVVTDKRDRYPINE